MRKLGEKFSFLTKILLVIGLLISNLSSLTVVFASETTEMVEVTLTDDTLNIKYLDQLAEEVEMVNVKVYENYTYLDGTFEEVENGDSLSAEEFLLEGYSQVSILAGTDPEKVENIELFDGLYEVKVEITDENEEIIDSAIYSKKFEYESGLNVWVLDSNDTEIVKLENGKYPVAEDNTEIKVVAQLLPGGLNPTDQFMFEDEGYMASEVVTELSFATDIDFAGRLFGDYKIPVNVELLKKSIVDSQELEVVAEENITEGYEEVVYTDSLDVLYGSYDLNTLVLNMATEYVELGNSYLFYGEEANGYVYALLDLENHEAKTMLDLYTIVNAAVGEDDLITYTLSNSEYRDVLATYDELSLNEELDFEEYMNSILLDDTAVVTIANEGLTISYKVVMAGDLNNDNALTEEDLLELINQAIGSSEETVSKSDLYGFDGKVNTLDVMYLNQLLQTKEWDVELVESEEAVLNARLDVEEKDIYSGDEFTVSYVLTLSDYAVSGVSGLFKYDEEMFELVSVETSNEWLGSNNEGKFLYLGSESLELPEIAIEEETETEVVATVEEIPEEVATKDYVVVTATFKALKAGSGVVTVEDVELFDQPTYLVLDNTVVESDEIVVNASNNNNLASLTVAGQEITLEENVLDYEIIVANDVTTADVVAVLENVAANITSIVYPEELAEGENTVVVTVTSEAGDVKVYTVTVIREEAPKKETTTQVNYNDYYDDYEEEKEVVTPEPEKEQDDKVEDDKTEEKSGNVSRIIIIILILLVIAGLIYLIFKDEDDEETKKANKEINKLKKEVKEQPTDNGSKNKTSKNKKKER